MKERKIMTTKTSRQTMMQHKSENEDRLIKSIEEDDFEFNYFQSNALNFLNISNKHFGRTAPKELKNIKYQPKTDFQILGSLRKQLSMTNKVHDKKELFELYKFQLDKVSINNDLHNSYAERVIDVVENTLMKVSA